MDKIKNKAFEWSIDYKPWEEDLHYRDELGTELVRLLTLDRRIQN